MKKKILITGSSGFIGSILSKKLSLKYNVFLIDKVKQNYNKNFYHIDLKSKKKLEDFFKKNKIKIIIHLASETFDNDPNTVYKDNIQCVENLSYFAKKYKIEQFIFASTISIYEKNYNYLIKETEKPSAKNKYGLSKIYIEKMLKTLRNINVTIFRLPIVIGQTRSNRIGILFELIRKGFPIFLIDNGKNKIQFVSIDELNLAVEKTIGLKGFNIFNIGCYKSYSFRENLEYIIKKTNSKSKFYSLNKYLGLFILNILIFFRLIDIHFYHKSFLTQNILLNLSKIEKNLKFRSKISSRDLFYSNYNNYIKNINKKRQYGSGSDKNPSLKIFNLLNFFYKQS